MRTLIHNIGQLVAVPRGPVRGPAMGKVPVVTEAALVIHDHNIAWFGQKADTPVGPFDQTIDARGSCVTPGLVDCHTHAVYVGDRASEFVQRIGGATYEQIMHAGGGIRTTMRAVREASLDDLVAQSAVRL